MTSDLILWKRKQPVKVKVLIDGRLHREAVRKLNLYGDGEKIHARAGAYGQMVPLTYHRGVWIAPPIMVLSVQKHSAESLLSKLGA